MDPSEIKNLPVPVKVYLEHRKAARISLAKREIIIRIPSNLSIKEREAIQSKFLKWAKETILQKKLYLTQDLHKDYLQISSLKLMEQEYLLQINYIKGNTASINISPDNRISVKIPESFIGTSKVNEYIKQLLIKVIPKYFHYKIWERVKMLNKQYFDVEVNKMTLKYISSRWGSCSSKGNINLSIRLLLAPIDVLDYVIIHELAHRIEMNHSDRFWALCERAMPDYLQKENLLRLNGRQYDF